MATVIQWIDTVAELVGLLWLLALYIIFIVNSTETTWLYLTVAGISSVALRYLLGMAQEMLPDANADAEKEILGKV